MNKYCYKSIFKYFHQKLISNETWLGSRAEDLFVRKEGKWQNKMWQRIGNFLKERQKSITKTHYIGLCVVGQTHQMQKHFCWKLKAAKNCWMTNY